ncbi:hypothetical protein [Parashewanella spongiae]|nr:hypothetical protein [Parashewanella spongiae]
MLSLIDSNSEKQRLKQIPIVNDCYQNQAKYNFEKQRRYLYLSSLLIILGICVFYAGFSKELFKEVKYEYKSRGVVLEGEPVDIYWDWRSFVKRSPQNIQEQKN